MLIRAPPALLSGTDSHMSAGVTCAMDEVAGTSGLSQGKVITAGWLTLAAGATPIEGSPFSVP